MGFRGTSYLSMDEKGRMVLPSRFRERLSEQNSRKVVVAKSPYDPCLMLYPIQQWMVLEEQVMSLPSADRSVRWLQRELVGASEELEVSANGRVLLPQTLRLHAGLEKKLVLIGQHNRMEVWGESPWQAMQSEFEGADVLGESSADYLQQVQL